MNKNTVIGFILIFVIFFGFTWYQSSQYKKQVEYQAQQDSIARAEQAYADSVWRAEHPEDTLSAALSSAPDRQVRQRIYRDSLLDVAHEDSSSYVTLANDKVEIVFNTKGAQPYSVLIKDYKTYDSTDLYLIKPGMSQYGITIYAGGENQ